MNTQWQLKTNGDPLGALRYFFHQLWLQAGIDGILIPYRLPDNGAVKPNLLDTPDQLANADPFAPLMLKNMAILAVELTQEYPRNRFGAVMRPCELRALIEMSKHDSFNLERVFLIGMECLGTFPAEDYYWRADRKHGAENLTDEILRFARQGGIAETRYRMACQMCDTPYPHGGHIHIAFVGLPVQEFLLISTGDDPSSEKLHLDRITDGPADPDLIIQNQRTLNRVKESRRNVRARVIASLEENIPREVNQLIEWLAVCGTCEQCMQECPICSVIMPEKTAGGRYEPWGIIRWLASCADCGMCEQACPNNLPLAAIFGNIRRELARAYGYKPGLSAADPLPH